MKTIIKYFILFIVLNAGTVLTSQKVSAQVSVSFQLFYDDLSPYGYWVNNTDYGYVWVPNVSAGFTPYGTNGHWVFTNAGWTWYSDYPWGWAPFHYGRWYSDPVYGPMWVPGNEWGPGWVTWRSSAGYYGWAPIGPGISIDIAYGNGYSLPYNQWTFVRDRDFGRTNINNYYIDRSTNTTIINNSTVINNIQSDGSGGSRYNAGPQRIEAEKRAGKSFTPVAIKESNTRGQKMNNNNLEIYKPRVENASGLKAAPAKVTSMKDVKPIKERNAGAIPNGKNQPSKSQLNQRQQNTAPAKQQPRTNQPVKTQPSHQQGGQPDYQKPAQQSRDHQPKREQPAQHQQKAQPERRQPAQPHDPQPKREQPAQHQQNSPDRKQPSQQPRGDQPNREHPQQHQQNTPDRQQQPSDKQPQQQPAQHQPNRQPQPVRSARPEKQQQPEHQQQQPDQPKNNGEEKRQH